MPKAELHLHIEGTLTPERLLERAEANGIDVPYASVEAVERAYDFPDLQGFLDLYYLGTRVLRTAEDFRLLMRDYLEVCRAQNIVHTEMFFDPQAHTERGIHFGTFMEGFQSAIDEARREWGQSACLIMCFLRHLPPDKAMATLREAMPWRDRFVGVGLDSSERDFPPNLFTDVFAAARAEGLRCVAHAGEEGPPGYVAEALDLLHAERIDHGVRAPEDSALFERIVRDRVPLTVCPLSNVRLRVFDTLRDHNVMSLVDAGACVTVNSDDPTYFGGYLNENLLALHETFGLTEDAACRLMANAFEASFLGPHEQLELARRLDAFVGERGAAGD